ncbi:SDR family oxidoreductase, partial [Campylobacter jejuni]|uniref:SDR family oxidoreductase n=1 Tax=Campylobacter jejuni TaxID=197 RepID=UPI001319D757
AMTKTFAKEGVSRNLRINCVTPGFIKSDMAEVLSNEVKQTHQVNIPLKRFAEPEEVANWVAFLLSDYAS